MCFKSPEERADIKLNFTSCGQVICIECLPRIRGRECKSCKNQCKTIKLAANCPKEISELFSDPMKNVKTIFKAFSFQEKNKIGYMQHQTGELTRLKDELVRLGREKEAQAKQLEKEMQRESELVEQEQNLKENLNNISRPDSRTGSDAGSWVEESRHQRRNLSRDFSDSSFSNILNITTESNSSNKPSHVRRLFSPPESSPAPPPSTSRFLRMKTPHGWHNNRVGNYENETTLNTSQDSVTGITRNEYDRHRERR